MLYILNLCTVYASEKRTVLNILARKMILRHVQTFIFINTKNI